MIACLKGNLLQNDPDHLIVDVGGVGYEVAFCKAGLKFLPELGDEVFLHIYTKIREDAIELFGFVDLEEKQLFVVLLSVSGVGPKVAINILSTIAPADLARAILSDDLARLTKLPGIGKKTAERLCLELKDKVQGFTESSTSVVSHKEPDAAGLIADDVISALVNLGYQQAKAREAFQLVLQRFPEETPLPPIEEILRLTLRSLA